MHRSQKRNSFSDYQAWKRRPNGLRAHRKAFGMDNDTKQIAYIVKSRLFCHVPNQFGMSTSHDVSMKWKREGVMNVQSQSNRLGRLVNSVVKATSCLDGAEENSSGILRSMCMQHQHSGNLS
ncbi:hypothetical protein TNCV_1402361 [Trichonephila clavipes]|nr:hypothetical protein TNCV_1402361 [Trichonephila clavipes]